MHDNNKKEDQQKVEVDEALTKNKFGLRKLIIIATRAGKIFALRSTDGSVVWAKFIRNSFPLAIFLSRSSAHPPPIGVVINRDLYESLELKAFFLLHLSSQCSDQLLH